MPSKHKAWGGGGGGGGDRAGIKYIYWHLEHHIMAMPYSGGGGGGGGTLGTLNNPHSLPLYNSWMHTCHIPISGLTVIKRLIIIRKWFL